MVWLRNRARGAERHGDDERETTKRGGETLAKSVDRAGGQTRGYLPTRLQSSTVLVLEIRVSILPPEIESLLIHNSIKIYYSNI